MDLLNVKDKKGKIQNPELTGSAFCISPYHPDFRTQVEDGVWPYVELLLNKNYFTINSCEGHFIGDSLEITVVFYDDIKFKKFVKHFDCFLINVLCEDSFINQYDGNKHSKLPEKEETKIVNWLFMISNEKYRFVTLFALKEFKHKNKLFLYIVHILYKTLFKKIAEKYLMYKIRSLPNYENL
jgi:hypothetical protein